MTSTICFLLYIYTEEIILFEMYLFERIDLFYLFPFNGMISNKLSWMHWNKPIISSQVEIEVSKSIQ